MVQRRTDLEDFFHPDGVAIIGQVNRALTADQLRAQHDPRWGADNWHLVNPKGGEVDGIPVYERVADVPAHIDLAVVSTPPAVCADIVEQCGAKGVRFALVFSSGFSEVGPEGAAHEEALAEAGRRTGVRIFGPNTNTNAFERLPEVPNRVGGKIGVVTQSGHNGRPIVQGSHFGIGFSRQIPCGNEVDLDVADFIEYFAYDDDTAVIAGYVEGFHDAGKLRRALQAAVEQAKPVVLMKMGATSAGARMASSHTGHLTGADAVIDGLFEQYGVVRVRDLDELLETAALFAKLPPGTGPNAALYSISGGSGTLMAEMAELAGVPVPRLGDATQDRLHEHIPAYLTVANPVDNGGQFITTQPPEIRKKVILDVLEDPAIDYVVIGVTGAVPPMTDLLGEDIVDLAATAQKPIVATWNSFKVDEPGFDLIIQSGVPLFRSFRNCFAALRSYADWQERAARFRPRDASTATLSEEARAVVDAHPTGGTLDPGASRTLLGAEGVPLAGEEVVTSAAGAVRASNEFGLPVVMKIASADFPHKSDLGLVRVGIDTLKGVREAYGEILAMANLHNPDARVDGVLVQEMVADGVEVIIGVTSDPTLGPAVMVGLGGIFAEVMADTAVRPVPLDRTDATEMVRSLRGFALLDGARGRTPADVDALVDLVVAVGQLAESLGPRLAELDLNPVVVRERGKGVVAVDHLVVLAPTP
ncbi:MAG: acetate--CoA ligase family protein [Acidimicrobiales bacterium]|nr:acetate--CoA ligase family protein [Acidimicrobiales bacterium]